MLQREQSESHDVRNTEIENELDRHRRSTVPNKGLALQNYKEKDAYLQHEVRFYPTLHILNRV